MKEQGTWSRTHPQLLHAAEEEETAEEEAAEEEAAEEEGDAEDIQH